MKADEVPREEVEKTVREGVRMLRGLPVGAYLVDFHAGNVMVGEEEEGVPEDGGEKRRRRVVMVDLESAEDNVHGFGVEDGFEMDNLRLEWDRRKQYP